MVGTLLFLYLYMLHILIRLETRLAAQEFIEKHSIEGVPVRVRLTLREML